MTERNTSHNSTYPKGGFSCSKDSFVVNGTLVFRPSGSCKTLAVIVEQPLQMTTDIKKYDFKAGLPQEFEIVDLAQLYAAFKDTLTTTHRTGFYHIIWFQQGSPTHLVDFNPIKVKPNTLLFLNKDIVQRFDDKSKFGGKAILFTDSFFCKTETDTKFLRSSILFNDLFSVSQIQINKTASLFADLFKLMEKELENEKDISQSDILKNLLHNFYFYLKEKDENKISPKSKKVLTLTMFSLAPVFSEAVTGA
jgi:AraC family transcriptional activator of pobA